MSNFEENRKAKEERKERDKASRENLGKFFYDLAKLSFATLVIGSTASVIIQENNLESWIIISIGAFVTYIFAYIGYKIIKLIGYGSIDSIILGNGNSRNSYSHLAQYKIR